MFWYYTFKKVDDAVNVLVKGTPLEISHKRPFAKIRGIKGNDTKSFWYSLFPTPQ